MLSSKTRWRAVSLAIFTAAALLSGTALGQQTNPGSGGSAGSSTGSNTGGTNNRRTPLPPQPTAPTPTPTPQDDLRPIYLSGRVLTDEGFPLTESVVIESSCNGAVRVEGYTDSKGRFNLQFGDKIGGAFQDATVGGLSLGNMRDREMAGPGNGARNLSNCELRARMVGYRSESVQLADRRPLDDPDVGTIVIHRLSESEGATVSASTLKAPKAARNAYEKAHSLVRKGKRAEAVEQYQKAVAAYPGFSAAWCELGELQSAMGDDAAALVSYRKSAEAEPNYLEPYVKMTSLHLTAHRWPELVESSSKLIALDGTPHPLAFLMNAVGRYNTRDFVGAEKSVSEAVRLDPDHKHPKSWEILGLLMAMRRDYAGAAAQLRIYLSLAPNASDADAMRARLSDFEHLTASVGSR